MDFHNINKKFYAVCDDFGSKSGQVQAGSYFSGFDHTKNIW